jgi:hypothetical protein
VRRDDAGHGAAALMERFVRGGVLRGALRRQQTGVFIRGQCRGRDTGAYRDGNQSLTGARVP